MESHAATITVKSETKVLLDALALLRRRPMEDLIHEAVLQMFGAVPEHSQCGVGPQEHAGPSPVKTDAEPEEQTLADRIRSFVLKEYVAPARLRGDETVRIVVREVHKRMNLEQRYPAVIAALQSRAFIDSGRLKLHASGKTAGASAHGYQKEFQFKLL